MADLGTLGGNYSTASGINASGQVVGRSYTATNDSHTFITGPNGVGMTDLNSLVHVPGGGTFIEASDINDAGQVIAIAIVMPTVPEPESYALLLAGLALIGLITQRKKMSEAATAVR
jgi:probable HAF family extracellular repeat protein